MADIAGNPVVQHDMVRKPVSALIWWYLPLALAFTSSAVGMTLGETAAVWTMAFAWMGAGCVLNAIRCHRLHCYLSGPAFIGGAVAAALSGMRFLQLGPHGLNYIVWGTLGLVLLSFVPEHIWRKYA
jgi:hypothetical protein